MGSSCERSEMLVVISLTASLVLSVSGAPFNLLSYFYPMRGPSVLLYPRVSLPLYSPPYFNIREQREPGRARHSGHGDHDHLDDHHDTDASIQTILKDLVKQSNQLAFTCEAEGTFPHPLDCSKYYLCDKDKEEGEEFDCLYNLTGLFFNKETGQCDWAAKTVCFSQKGDDDIEAVEAEIDYDCEVPGVFPDPDYCMRYIRCNKELFASLEYCTTGTFFDEYAEKCLWASQVDCGNREQVDLGFEDDIIRRFQLF